MATLAQVAVVEADLPCLHCGYNLRTLAATAVCPECGKPVQDALINPLTTEKPWRINLINLGAWWLATGLLIEAVVMTISLIMPMCLEVDEASACAIALIPSVAFPLTRVRPTALRNVLLGLLALTVALFILGILPLEDLSDWRLVTWNAFFLCKAAGMLCMAVSIPGNRKPWATFLLVALLPACAWVVAAAILRIDDYFWLIPNLPFLLMPSLIFVTLHVTHLARRCQIVARPALSRCLPPAVIFAAVFLCLVFVLEHLRLLGSANGSATFEVLFLTAFPLWYATTLVLAAYLIRFAQRFRPPAPA